MVTFVHVNGLVVAAVEVEVERVWGLGFRV